MVSAIDSLHFFFNSFVEKLYYLAYAKSNKTFLKLTNHKAIKHKDFVDLTKILYDRKKIKKEFGEDAKIIKLFFNEGLIRYRKIEDETIRKHEELYYDFDKYLKRLSKCKLTPTEIISKLRDSGVLTQNDMISDKGFKLIKREDFVLGFGERIDLGIKEILIKIDDERYGNVYNKLIDKNIIDNKLIFYPCIIILHKMKHNKTQVSTGDLNLIKAHNSSAVYKSQ
ncbi:MAG: hypothetical protein OMM_06117 [Candidatus Magnetoglobus multicellularis str. Araruama]|uniref:Uncharacterized protein n=1 Tax=Candidatus Magnetoglobus multicellularis str. Araruama TaxID=890399 RepID=A0A1V1NRG4_9BACT|nr:MAG: hypothetical protein OMM_06117 [Candidatus Magnetoglobus multicellularis str. Araruama]